MYQGRGGGTPDMYKEMSVKMYIWGGIGASRSPTLRRGDPRGILLGTPQGTHGVPGGIPTAKRRLPSHYGFLLCLDPRGATFYLVRLSVAACLRPTTFCIPSVLMY